MISKRLMAALCGLAVIATASAADAAALGSDALMAETNAMDADEVFVEVDADADAEVDAEEELDADQEVDEEFPVYARTRRPSRRARTIVVGREEIPGLIARMPYIQWAPYRHPEVVIPRWLARRLIGQLYGANPETVYTILRQLPLPARVALRAMIDKAADPRAYVPLCTSFLSMYAEATPAELALAETGAEVDLFADEEATADADDAADEEQDVEEELEEEADEPAFLEAEAEFEVVADADEEANPAPAAPAATPAATPTATPAATPAAPAAPAAPATNAAVESLTKLATTLDAQVKVLEQKVAEAKRTRPASPWQADRGPVGRMPTNATRIINPDGMRSWEATAKADILRKGNDGKPIAVQQAEYLSVIASPRDGQA